MFIDLNVLLYRYTQYNAGIYSLVKLIGVLTGYLE